MIVPILKRTYNSISKTHVFTPQNMEAHIALIPKPENDHTLCNNYRQISLTNIDTGIRLYSNIISNRLTPILPRHINLGQTGFTKGRETRNNIIKTCTIVDYAQRADIPAWLL